MRSIPILVLLFLTLVTPALASDGVLEINQTCALETGCFVGDSAGFPVTITAPGSYRLTSSLNPTGASVILIGSSRVQVDLNGFGLTTSSPFAAVSSLTLPEKVDSREEASLLLRGVHDGKAEDEETVLG